MGMESKVTIPTTYSKEFLEAIDLVFLGKKEEQALNYLSKFKDKKVVATISGKDSTVSAHLMSRIKRVDVLINRYIGRRKLPDAVIEELVTVAKHIGAENIIISELTWDSHSTLFHQIAKHYDYEVIVTGLRVQEDDEWPDAIRIGTNKEVIIASPLKYWKHSDVWAYIWKHQIPMPSAYRDALPWESLQSLLRYLR